MNKTTTCITTAEDSAAAARELAAAIRRDFDGAAADAVALFASARHDYERLLAVLAEEVGTTRIVGSSSAGEFAGRSPQVGAVSALAIRSNDMRFAVGVGRDIRRDPIAAARQVVAGFAGTREGALPYRAALVMTDALAGHSDALVEELTVATGGGYVFFGGGAGDDGRFQETHVFAGTRAYSDAVAALEIQSPEPLGVGVSHGWEPASPPLRVTEVEGARVVSLNGAPAADAFAEHAERTGQSFDRAEPLPFFLHNILGIATAGEYRLRVPLGIDAEGAVLCAAAVPAGAVVHVMATSEASAVAAAQNATRSALASLGGRRPGGALVFDCVATRLRLGKAFDHEVDACADLLRPAPMVGCNTYGQIARAEGQFGGFHNCTAVVCVLPE